MSRMLQVAQETDRRRLEELRHLQEQHQVQEKLLHLLIPFNPLIKRELGSVQRSCRGEVHRLLEELRARERRTQVGGLGWGNQIK